MSGHFEDDEPVARRPQQPPQPGRVDCGECPAITSGCKAGHCLKAPATPPPKIQIGTLDC
ncbi:hypothetical protein PEC18_12170 [Paucibacter sp. O1-1]|nr:hypothetical protein [Paucibacter sp. O1-1]MDA3826572.1 hypothetical protein [Paucibacter sp. O1-1]